MQAKQISSQAARIKMMVDQKVKLTFFSGKAPSSASAYLELLGALPSLHAASLKLLRVWVRAGSTSLTPYFGSISRLLNDLLSQNSVKSLSGQTAWQVREEVCQLPLRK